MACFYWNWMSGGWHGSVNKDILEFEIDDVAVD